MEGKLKTGSGRDTPTSKEFADQIRQLELEGSRLIEATNTLGDSFMGEGSHANRRSSPMSGSIYTGPDISALTDITSEQKTILELKEHLDLQSRETERLHHTLFGGPMPLVPQQSPLDNLEIPIRTDMHSRPVQQQQSRTHHIANMNQDRSMSVGDLRGSNSSQEEIAELRAKLTEATNISEKQKEEFRRNVEELRTQLQEAIIGRNTVLAKQKYETSGQDAIIQRLQKSIEQLENTNRTQEKALLELNEKCERMQKQHYIVETSIAQLRQLLQERERRRGNQYYDTEPVDQQSITMLVHTVERCIQEHEGELEYRQERIKQLSLENDSLKSTMQERMDIHTREHENRLREVREECDRKVAGTGEKIQTSDRQLLALQEQLVQQQQAFEREFRGKSDQVLELEGRLTALRREMEDQLRQAAAKRDSLQRALDLAEKDKDQMSRDKERAEQHSHVSQTRHEDLQKSVDKLSSELSNERGRGAALQEKEAQWRLREERHNLELKHKEEVIKRLEESLAAVRKEADAQVQSTISSMEKEGKDYIERQITQLKTQLEAMTDRCHKVQLEAELAKSELKNTKEKLCDVKKQEETLRGEVSTLYAQKDSVQATLRDRMIDIDRAYSEREGMAKLVEQRGMELIALKAEKDKLQIQLEEREKNFLSLKQQHESINQIVDSHSHKTVSLRQERDELQQRINDKIIETEEIRRQRDAVSKKLRGRERRIEELEGDNTKLAREILEQQQIRDKGESQCAGVLEELKQSRYEVASLMEQRQNMEQQLINKEALTSRENAKMHRKLKALEKELKMTHQALQAQENVDGKAVKVAGKMQKEVTEKRGQIDSLQTRLRWLEECLDAALKDKKGLQEENEKLSSTVEQSSQQSERQAAQLKHIMKKYAEEQDKVAKLQAAKEKITLQQSSSQASIEQLQQDMTRLKLKHQLELKEAIRSGQARKQGALPPDAYKPSQLSAPYKIVTIEKPAAPAAPAPACKQHLLEEEKPVSIKPQQGQVAAAADNGVGKELRALLEEMKGLVQGHQSSKHCSSSHRAHFPESVPRHSSSRRAATHSSSCAHNSHRPTSPVSDLILGASTLLDEDDTDYGVSIDVESVKDYLAQYKQKQHTKDNSGVTALGEDAQSLAKRLERKIDSLSKIGGQLQSNNKEVSALMKDQERKLRRVKGQIPGKG